MSKAIRPQPKSPPSMLVEAHMLVIGDLIAAGHRWHEVLDAQTLRPAPDGHIRAGLDTVDVTTAWGTSSVALRYQYRVVNLQ